MSKSRPQVLSMNGGEVDNETIARSDLESYSNKCALLANAMLSLKGGFSRMPGNRFLGYSPDGPGEDLASRFSTWRFSRTQSFSVELTSWGIRLVYDLGFVQAGDGVGAFDAGGWVDASSAGGSISPTLPTWPIQPGDPGASPPPDAGGGGDAGPGGNSPPPPPDSGAGGGFSSNPRDKDGNVRTVLE